MEKKQGLENTEEGAKGSQRDAEELYGQLSEKIAKRQLEMIL